MGGTMAAGGGNKATGNATNTGAPAWTSGATGNNAIGGPGNPTAAAGGGAVPAGTGQIGGDWATPGTDAFNNMNNALTTQPMGNLVNILQSGGMGGTMNSAMNNLAGSTGSNDWMNQAAGMFNQMGQQGTQNYQDILNASKSPWANEQYLTDTASGKMLAGNPYVEDIVKKGQDEAGTGVNQMFAAGGRYGGGANQGTLADSYQNVGNQFRGAQYDAERNRQLQAANAISGEQGQRGQLGLGAAQGMGNIQSGAASGLGGLGQNAMQNWMGSQQAAAGLQNQGIQNQFGAMGQLGNVQANKMFDAQQQAGVGEATTAASQAQINDLINQWTSGDMEDWSRLGGLLSAGTGSAGSYGTQTGSQTSSSQPGWGSILGGVLSLVGMSDRRTKTDIEPLNATLAGVPLYQYRYRIDPTTSHIGVMADEAKELHPDAVIEINGYDFVDYGVLLERQTEWA